MTQTIGIIGSGLVGKAVTHLAVAAGYNVVISNSRGPETLAALVEALGLLARAGSVDEAIAAGDIVSVAIPLAAFEALPGDKFAGKVVLDAGSLADSWRIEPNTPIYFWRYAPVVPQGVSGDEAKRIYQQPGKPVSPEEARRLIAAAERPSPIGGTLDVHIDLFLEQASADTIKT